MQEWFRESFSQYRRRVAAALGQRPPDKVFTGCRVLNVFTGEILEQDFGIVGERIAYLGTPGRHNIGKDTEVIDLKEKIVVPGYFDPHAHTDLYYTPWEFARAVASSGTTAIFSDSHDMANGLGMAGFTEILSKAKKFPLRFLSGVPLASPPYPVEGEDLYDREKVRRLLTYKNVIASGSELTPWVKVIRQDEVLMEKLFLVRRTTGRIEGHTVGAKGEKLAALVSAGITSCHESMSLEDVEERLRLGLYVMLRQGSIRKEFTELSPLLKRYHPRLMLTPDGLFADEIADKGYMDYVLTEALRHGGDPVSLIRMATLNPAVYFGLEAHLGGIAPGRLADFNVLEEIGEPRPLQVWIGGTLVSHPDKGITPGPVSVGEIPSERPFRIPRLTAADFSARYPEGFAGEIPVIDIVNHTVTGVYRWSPSGENDGQAEPAKDVLKIAMIHREGPGSGMGIGFVHGFGLDGETQIASSVAHETHNLLVVGSDEEQMAQAANEVVAMGGGIVVRSHGETAYRFPLTVGGMMSPLPMEEVGRALIDLRDILHEKGCPLPDPLWTFGFLSFTSILRLRITISGIYDVQGGKILYNAKV